MKKLLFLTVPMILAGSIALTNNNITGTYADYERPKGDFVVEPKPFETVPGIGGKIIDITAPIGGFENTPKLRKYQYEDIEENGSYEGLYSQFTDIATRQSYLGYGYNIITSPYLDSDHVKMQYPIIDRDKIQSSSLVLDRKLYTNSKSYKATSMSEFAQSYGGSFKIYGNYGKVFSGGLALEYQAAQEEKEFYYFYKGVYNVRTFTLRMLETEESIMEMLSSQFANDLNSSMHPDTLFQRYGTHLILGATMGGRMEVNET